MITNRGTVYCESCGEPLYDYIEFVGANGEMDGDITHTYCHYEGDLCEECARLEEEMNEEEGEEEK
ncbi:MAG: hypothetical protein MJZ37_01025 [Bacilli bacterium]|nr:hypothetical protein [Bacilli bacterium]